MMRSSQCCLDNIDVLVCKAGTLPFVIEPYNPFISTLYIIPYRGDYGPFAIS